MTTTAQDYASQVYAILRRLGVTRHPAQNHAPQMHAALRARTAGRIEDYRWLRDEIRLTTAAAAQQMGITERTARRYEAASRSAA